MSKTSAYKLSIFDIMSQMKTGSLADSTVFETEHGLRLAYVGNQLKWVTSKGYVSSPVNITDDVVSMQFKKGKPLAQQGKKLSSNQVLTIHDLYNRQGKSVKQIAEQYGVSVRMIDYIVQGQHWTDEFEYYHTPNCM